MIFLHEVSELWQPRISLFLVCFELEKFAFSIGWLDVVSLKYGVFYHDSMTRPISAFLPFLSVDLENYVNAFGANVEP